MFGHVRVKSIILCDGIHFRLGTTLPMRLWPSRK